MTTTPTYDVTIRIQSDSVFGIPAAVAGLERGEILGLIVQITPQDEAADTAFERAQRLMA